VLAGDPVATREIRAWQPPNGLLHLRHLALHHAGRLDEAQAVAELGYEEALEAGVVSTQGVWCHSRGRVAMLQGRPRSALRTLEESVRLLADHDPFLSRPYAMALLAEAAAIAGDLPRARDVVAELETLSLGSNLPVSMAEVPKAWIAAMTGQVRSASSMLIEAAKLGEPLGLRVVTMGWLHDAVRLGDPAGVERLTELAKDCDGELWPLLAAHGLAFRADDAEELNETSKRFVAIGANLYAAEAAAHAAISYRQAGRETAGAAAARRSRALALRCEGASTPALADLGRPALLSPREAEIARLVASGLTSRQVAQELTVSVRTVENQLARVYAKLGITRRGELCSALGVVPPTASSPEHQ
jgi:DNA-binding CsgD family transcriptional regulator